MSIALTFHITLETPALFSALEGEPNSAVSYPYIPGSTLRGMAVGAWLRKNKVTDLDLANTLIQDLFFNGSVRWLNAYPLIEDKRGLPVPLSWFVKKYPEASEKHTLYLDKPQVGKAKNPNGFFHLTNGLVKLVEPQRSIKIHVQRNREFGRAIKREDDVEGIGGTIYRYDGLAAGQTFGAAVVCKTVEQARYLRDLIEKYPQAALGGARTAGYGRVKLSDFCAKEKWQETPELKGTEGTLQITLLSDMLLRNEYGQPCADVPTLLSALNMKSVSVQEAYIAQDIVGGFNRKWGLPLPQTPALKKGSVLILRGMFDTEKLIKLSESGIGERRAEGYGRLGFEWLSNKKNLTLWSEDKPSEEATSPLQDPKPRPVIAAPPYKATVTLRRLMRQRLAQAVIADSVKIIPKEFKVYDGLETTQINRLRAEVRTKLNTQPLSTDFKPFFDGLRQTARKQFEGQYLDNQKLPNWIASLTLSKHSQAIETKYKAIWQAEDYAHAKLMLIDAVLARMAKLSKKEDDHE